MIDWPKVVQDLEAENARLKKDLEQFQIVMLGQIKLNRQIAATSYRAAAEVEKTIKKFGGVVIKRRMEK